MAAVEINNQINNTIRNSLKQKISDELNYLSENPNLNIFSNFQDINLENRKRVLQEILSSINKSTNINSLDINKKRQELNSEMGRYTYRKQWNKLSSYHKIIKIKEYIKSKLSCEDSNPFYIEIINKLIQYTEDGKLSSKKNIVYDPNTATILDLPIIQIDIEKKTYKLI